VGIGLMPDGSVLIGDDSNNVIYRVTSNAVPTTLTPQKLAHEILVPGMAATLSVGSPAFVQGGFIPAEYSAYGEGRSPPLAWNGLPANTRSIVLMMEDPQATSPLPFVHWLAVIPPWVRQLPEGIPPIARLPGVPNAQQGSNSRTETGYFGPRPPAGDPPHPYHFQVFALDVALSLPPGFNRHALIEAMRGHVLARGELVGTFAR
jgi:Raf kinase inhibitor-like YbhB/YbcL family protein